VSSLQPYYKDELITLYNADSIDNSDLWSDCDSLVTDPPYGVRFEHLTTGGKHLATVGNTSGTDYIRGDRNTDARDAVLRKWGWKKPCVMFGSWRAPRPENVRSRIVWYKSGGGIGLTNCTVMSTDEEIYLIGDGFVKTTPGAPSVWRTDEHRGAYSGRVGHPNAKPIPLMERLIRLTTGSVADPFSGSGSTLVAARNLGRKAIGFELDERYCEIAARRLSQQTLFTGDGDE
jgi:site-specific DNA-methyltransferase (adenine-specific)